MRSQEGCLRLSAQATAAWINAHKDLLRGVLALRSLGAQADDAVAAVLAVREVRVARLSHELFERLAQPVDPGVLVEGLLGDRSYDIFCRALYGDRSESSP